MKFFIKNICSHYVASIQIERTVARTAYNELDMPEIVSID
jgi:hypothetical protein